MSAARERELRASLLQTVVEVDRGIQIAQAELRAGGMMQARQTLDVVRAMLPLQERLVQELGRELREGEQEARRAAGARVVEAVEAKRNAG